MKRILLLTLLCLPWLTDAAPKPNFLHIIADDWTYRDLGVYGGQAKTPHLDKLANGGARNMSATTLIVPAI